jgi:hypothetical protein
MAERSVGDFPSAAPRADKVLGRHSHVGEEHLVEIEAVAVDD